MENLQMVFSSNIWIAISIWIEFLQQTKKILFYMWSHAADGQLGCFSVYFICGLVLPSW